MNFADMLSFADIQQLTRIAHYYNCECNENSKNDLIQSILSTVSRRDILEQHINRLSLEDLRFLNSILFDQRNSFSLEELVARVGQTRFAKTEEPAPSPRDTIMKFKHLGWLFNGYSHHSRYLFQVPLDLRDRFREALAHRFRSELTFTGEPSVYRDEQMLILDDFHQFLRYVYEQVIPLNMEGAMYRKNQQQLFERFAVNEDLVAKGGWRFGYGRRFKEYPNRFSLLYDFAYYQGYIEERDNRLTLTQLGQDCVAEGTKAQLTQLYRFWLRLYKGAIPNLSSLVHWVDICARNWVSVPSLRKIICPFIKPYYYDDAESILEERILKMMLHLGLLRFGEDEQEGRSVVVTKLGSALIQGIYVPHEDKIELPVDK